MLPSIPRFPNKAGGIIVHPSPPDEAWEARDLLFPQPTEKQCWSRLQPNPASRFF